MCKYRNFEILVEDDLELNGPFLRPTHHCRCHGVPLVSDLSVLQEKRTNSSLCAPSLPDKKVFVLLFTVVNKMTFFRHLSDWAIIGHTTHNSKK